MVWENNANILSQMLANNEINDSLILEKAILQQEEQNKQLASQIDPKLDVYLRNDNFDNEVISGPEDMYIDDDYENNLSRILLKNSLTVNDSVTAESVEDMLYLDTNSRRHPLSKKHQKELLPIDDKIT